MPRLDRGPSSLTPRWREMDSNHPVDQDRAFPFKAEQDLLIRGVTVLANVAPWRNDLDTHRQIVRTAMLGAEFDDRITIRPNRLPIGLALFGLQYNPCPFYHAHDDLPLRRFPAKFLAGRLSGQSVFTAFRVPMRVNSLCYGSGTDGSQTRRRGELDSRRGPCHGDFAGSCRQAERTTREGPVACAGS